MSFPGWKVFQRRVVWKAVTHRAVTSSLVPCERLVWSRSLWRGTGPLFFGGIPNGSHARIKMTSLFNWQSVTLPRFVCYCRHVP